MNLNLNNYKSCIKLGGVPILPPLLTSIRRKEMQKYKKEAKEIEFKLNRKKLFTQCMNDIIKLQPQLSLNPKQQQNAEHEQTVITLENQLTFDNDVPLINNNEKTFVKDLNLIRETIDVSEYSENGVRLINNSNSSTDNTVTELNNLSSDISTKEFDISSPIRRPRLVRSNSYVLASPSPILLAHLQKENENKIKQWSSLDNNLITNDNNLKNDTKPIDNNKDTFQVTETDVRIETVTVKTPIKTNNSQLFDELFISQKSTPIINNKKIEIDPQLNDILKELPENYSKKILEIIEKQKIEQELIQKSYENLIKNQLLIDNNLCNEISDNNLIYDKNKRNTDQQIDDKPKSISISSSQSLYYTITNSPSETLSTPKMLIVEDSFDEKNLIKEIELKREKERQWAASIIGAAVKGYLIRRLMKTNKVQMLIQTIKDAALCALQLESVDNIQESDIELHRRLIHQVSSACYGFYDIFFTLTINERMEIIANDRQKKIEKATKKRPLSATGSNTSITKIVDKNS